MTRYAKRPWYTPIGFMNSAPHSYAPLLMVLGAAATFPLRYKISEYFERQRDGPHVELRRRAVLYYNEMERMHRRQALQNLPSLQDDDSGHRLSAVFQTEAMRMGHVDQEYNYWHAHQRDALRAEKLLSEVRELQTRISESQAQKANWLKRGAPTLSRKLYLRLPSACDEAADPVGQPCAYESARPPSLPPSPSMHSSVAIAPADAAPGKVPSPPLTERREGALAGAAPLGSAALCGCLDLLVKAQKTQSESVAMLRALHERLFPSPAPRADARAPAVPFDDADGAVVRLRVTEMKLSGLHPRLSAAVDGAVRPFRPFARAPGHPAREAYRRVLCLRDQLTGLAQLQGEAMRSLGAQLSSLFTLPRGGNALYYYPNTHDSHSAVREFLQQLLDVMASKQHIVVCLAMALREIYDPDLAALCSPDDISNARDGVSAARCVSVSLSPPSTTLRGASRSPSATQPHFVAFSVGPHTSASPEMDHGVSPTSGSPRSPLSILAEANTPLICAPPPPLATHLQDLMSTHSDETEERSINPKSQEGTNSGSHGDSMGVTEEQCAASDDLTVRVENVRLREMLDAKDKIILEQQSQILGVMPSLVERAESSCACRSSSSSAGRRSRDSSVAPQRSVEKDADNEVPQLRDALQLAQDERSQWKRTASALTAENRALRARLQDEQATSARLQADIIKLKKQWLTAEASGLDEALPRFKRDRTQKSLQKHEQQKHPKEPENEDLFIAAPSSETLRAKRSALFAKLRRAPAESDVSNGPMVILSPLTEERRLPPSSSSPATERRLSPEYCSPPRSQSPPSTVPAEEVSRILSSARSLLRSLKSGAANGDSATAPPPGSRSGSGSERTSRAHSFSSSSSAVSFAPAASRLPNDSAGAAPTRAGAEEGAASVSSQSRSPANGALSPCSSVSYSAAKQRGARGDPSPQKRPPPLPPPPAAQRPQQKQQQQRNAKGQMVSQEPQQQRQQRRAGDGKVGQGGLGGGRETAVDVKTKARPGTARDALMRELREQLSHLRNQHEAVLCQAEELRVKRQEVTAAFQRRIEDSMDKRSGDAAKQRERLASYLARFDAAQSKVQENEARARESADIVERQLQTLEDDLL